MRHNRLRSAGKTANGRLAAQRRGISLPMAGMQACNTLRKRHGFGYPPPFRDSKPHFPASLHRFRRHGRLCPKGNKSAAWSEPRFPNLPWRHWLCSTGSEGLKKLCSPHFETGKGAMPSHPPGLEAAFPASLYRFGRRGWLCPEGNKSAAWEVRQIAPALQHRSCAASLINFKKDSACPVLAFERAIPILHRRRPRRIAVCVHRKSGWNPERKRPLPFRATAQRNGLFSMFLFACSAFLFDAVSGHSPSGKSEGTVSPGTKAHAAQVKGSHANPCKPAWAEKP